MSEEEINKRRGNEESQAPSTAVWYFVAATFLFSGSMIYGDAGGPALRIVGLVIGAVIFAAGVVVLRRELAGRNR